LRTDQIPDEVQQNSLRRNSAPDKLNQILHTFFGYILNSFLIGFVQKNFSVLLDLTTIIIPDYFATV